MQIADFERAALAAAPEARGRHAHDASAAAREEEILNLKMALLAIRDDQARTVGAHISQLSGLQTALSDDPNLQMEQERLAQEQRRHEQQAALLARFRFLLAQRDRNLSAELVLRDRLSQDLAVARRNLKWADRQLRVLNQLDDLAIRTSPEKTPATRMSWPQTTRSALGRTLKYLQTGRSFVAAGRLRHVLAGSPLFDAAWYLGQRPDLEATNEDLLDHFVFHGIDEGTSPNPLIDAGWIAEKTGLGQAAMRSYLTRGRFAEVCPSPLFDVQYYRTIAGLGPSADALSHYLRQGRAAGLSPHPLFDHAFYGSQLPQLARWPVDPLVHYISAPFELDPHPLFSNEFYLRQHPELRELGICPLSHYLEYGYREKTSPHPAFSGSAYLGRYQDVAAAGQNPLLHYVVHGKDEGRTIDPVS